MPIYVLTVHASDETCREGYHSLGEAESGIDTAKCEFNSAFIIRATRSSISWQESLLNKAKKKIKKKIKMRLCRKYAAVRRVGCQFVRRLLWP